MEGFLTIALVFSHLDTGSKFWGMIIGAVLFLIVVGIVSLLVWLKPTHLTFRGQEHLNMLLASQKMWGTSDKPEIKSQVEEAPQPPNFPSDLTTRE